LWRYPSTRGAAPGQQLPPTFGGDLEAGIRRLSRQRGQGALYDLSPDALAAPRRLPARARETAAQPSILGRIQFAGQRAFVPVDPIAPRGGYAPIDWY
jgi:hypothetical protein